MLSSIGTQLLDLMQHIGYPWLFGAMFLENIFPPIPSELIMPFGGFLAAQWKMNIGLVILTWVAGTYLGVLPFYLAWWRWHKERLLGWTDRFGKYLWISREDVKQAFDAFHKRGYTFVLVGRFVPLFRTVISFPAWSVRMPFRRYSVYTLIGSSVRCGMLAYLWYIVGDQRHLVGDFMGKYEHIILILLAALLVWRIVKKVYKNIQKNNK